MGFLTERFFTGASGASAAKVVSAVEDPAVDAAASENHRREREAVHIDARTIFGRLGVAVCRRDFARWALSEAMWERWRQNFGKASSIDYVIMISLPQFDLGGNKSPAGQCQLSP